MNLQTALELAAIALLVAACATKPVSGHVTGTWTLPAHAGFSHEWVPDVCFARIGADARNIVPVDVIVPCAHRPALGDWVRLE